jgi:predicted TIM-barrel fold metal-dependent hydrolase
MPSPRRIDLHFHLIPKFYQDAVYAAGTGPQIGRYPDWSPQRALELMDAHGIEVALTSLAQPGVQFGERAHALALARRCNDYAAELNARWPKRFGALAVVPMWEIGDAIEEIGRALDVLKLQGVCLFASYGEKFLGDPHFDPVLGELDQRAAVAFIHPGMHPSSRKLDLRWPGFMMEYLFDTTRAAVNLAMSGATERFARVRFVLAHAGGLMPYFAWRLSIAPMIDARLEQLTPAQVFARLARFWYDTALSPTPPTLACLAGIAKPEQVVFGTDWPFANARVIAEAMRYETAAIPGGLDRNAIDRGNALALFPQFA